MSAALAILAGTGALPQMLAAANPQSLFVSFEGVDVNLPKGRHLAASFNKFGALFDGLRTNGVTQVVFAGAMTRPALNPAEFDAKTASLAPRLMAAMAGGDDGLLREIVAVFEAEGFAVTGPNEIAPDLLATAGLIAGPKPSETDLKDSARGMEILSALGPLDLGQGAVVAAGLCLGIETLQGTDAMLEFVANTPAHLRRAKGVFVKAPKQGQDLRMDMPAIGPDTVAMAARAGLAGIVVSAGNVLVLDRTEVINQATAAGLFLLAV